MVPLMDCVFLLMTFFIYIATQMVLERGIPVDLAHASSAEPLSNQQQPIHLFIRRDGMLFFDDRLVSVEELPLMLHGGDAQKPVVVHADKGVLHEQVVQVLDAAREGKVSEVILAVEPVKERPR
jgi:biopolymer transport protein ExbD